MQLYPFAMPGFHFPISPDSEQAQLFFDQGFQLMYSFAKTDAARSFQAPRLAYPDSAVCYWSEAWASHLNGAMNTAPAPRACAALQHALAHSDSATTKEAGMIGSLESSYAN